MILINQSIEYIKSLGHYVSALKGKMLYCTKRPNGKSVIIYFGGKNNESITITEAEIEGAGGYFLRANTFKDVENFFRHPGAPKG